MESPQGLRVVGCGQTSPDLEALIVHPETGVECHPDEVGEIRVHGASVAQGYWNRPDESDLAFQSSIIGDGRRWFRTGDYGYLKNGELFITGRMKDLIIIRGRNIYPQDVEQLVERHLDFVEANTCAAFTVDLNQEEHVVIVVEGTRDMVRWSRSDAVVNGEVAQLQGNVDLLQRALVDQFDFRLSDLMFVRPSTFPRTSSGKVQRRLCRKMYLEHNFDVLLKDMLSAGQMDDSVAVAEQFPEPHGRSVRSELQQQETLIIQVLGAWGEAEQVSLPSITRSTPFSSLGVDSVAAADIVLRLEKLCGVRIEPELLRGDQTVSAVAQLLVARREPIAPQPSKSSRVWPVGCDDTCNESQPDTTWSTHFANQNARFESLKREGVYFYDSEIEACDGAWVTVGGRRMLMLASYNYLGFISDERVIQASKEAIDIYGIGQHGSRLISGTTSQHKALERELAEFMQAEDSIVFNSGYVTNLASVAALVGPGDVVLGDEWNHASIVDGCRFSGAEFRTFRHNDMSGLERLLRDARPRRTLLAVDAVFSMEGDIAPLPRIAELSRSYGALLLVDEAHSLGTIGATGRGLIEHFGLDHNAIDVKMGTLSKSFGACGGFIASSKQIIGHLRHHARGYIFSVATPVPQVVAVRKALEVLRSEPDRVRRLANNSAQFRLALHYAGFRIHGEGTQIVPIVCETETQAFAFTKRCRELGLFVVPIVYPAVPMNAPRVRTNLTALHTPADIRMAVELLIQAGRDAGLLAGI